MKRIDLPPHLIDQLQASLRGPHACTFSADGTRYSVRLNIPATSRIVTATLVENGGQS